MTGSLARLLRGGACVCALVTGLASPRWCRAADGAWSETLPEHMPARYSHSVVYDAARHRLLMFGGQGPATSAQVWELPLGADERWRVLATTGAGPPALFEHTAIYDPMRDRMLVFGGSPVMGGALSTTVWSLALDAVPVWQALTVAGTPPGTRRSHTAIYDPVGDRMIVFGGLLVPSNTSANDVWSLSLSGSQTWAALAPSGTPPLARRGHVAIYDPPHARMVVMGGLLVGSVFASDVHTLDLGPAPSWSQLPTSNDPPGRTSHVAVYDAALGRLIIEGGTQSAAAGTDTWSLNLAGPFNWVRSTATLWGLTGIGFSGSLQDHAAVMDPIGKRIIVCGGVTNGTALNRTDCLDLGEMRHWDQMIWPTTRATADDPSLVRDVVRGRTLAFSREATVWELHPGTPLTWSVVPTIGADSVLSGLVQYVADSGQDRVLCFSSLGGPPPPRALSFATSAWSTLTSSPGPNHVWDVVADPARGRLLAVAWSGSLDLLLYEWLPGPPGVWNEIALFKANAGDRHLAIEYEPAGDRLIAVETLRGSAEPVHVWALPLGVPPVWTELSVAGPAPSGDRNGPGFTYDSARQTFLFLGGDSPAPTTDAWELDLRGSPTWRSFTPSGPAPDSRSWAAVLSDSSLERLQFLGGTRGFGGKNDLWTLTLPPVLDVPEPGSGGLGLLRMRLAPNPARASQLFEIDGANDGGTVSLQVFSVDGRLVWRRELGPASGGAARIQWDGRDLQGQRVPTGVYFATIRSGARIASRRLVRLD